MARQDIERLFEHDLGSLRNAICALADGLGHDLDPSKLGWIGTASKRQLLIEAIWMISNAR